MKKIIYIAIAMLAMNSCLDPDSLLDKEKVGDLYERDVFTNHIYANRFLADIYFNVIHYNTGGAGYEHAAGWNGAWLDCATDNGEARNLESDAQKMNSGNWNATDLPLNSTWEKNYSQIRACNKLLKYCDIIPLAEGFGNMHREYMRAQAMFLRAFHYHELLRAFGGVPIVVDVLAVGDPRLLSERSSFDTTVEFIVGECETAADIFASVYEADPSLFNLFTSNYGRANRGSALALRAKVLAMAASPLFNRPPSTPGYDSADPDAELWRYLDYDRERWLRAAEACKDVTELGIFDLATVKSGTKTAYETFFTQRAPSVGNAVSEGIFSVLKGANNEIFYNNLPFDFMNIYGRGTPVCYNLPTHDLVASYEMANGMFPEQPGSGFRPLDQFSGRDPRLNATIWHDGSVFCGIEFETWRRNATSSKPNGKHYITGYSRTGYFLRKFMDVDLIPYNNNVNLPNTCHIMRYADILLLYAEALNEYHDDPGDEAQLAWAFDRVRARAGMPGLAETFANRGWDMTQDNVREQIRNERRVEFAFEEQRFWDVRRWMIGGETQREVHEMDIVLREDNINRIYAVRKIENRAWDDRMNMMPLPQSELNKNPNLKQNWGWQAPPIQQ